MSAILLIYFLLIIFRYIGNYEHLLKWSSRNKKKLRQSAEYPVSARESFDSWNKVIDSGTMRQASVNPKEDSEEEYSTEEDSEEVDSKGDSEEEDSEDEEDEVQEKKKEKKSHKPYSSEEVTEGEKRPVKIDYSFMGSSGTASGSMGNDGMVVRQPSIVRDLWAQVSHYFLPH